MTFAGNCSRSRAAHGVEIGAGPHERGDARELAGVEEILLHVGDVHDREMLVGARRVLAKIQDVADAERLRAFLRLDAERIADLQAEPRAERAGDRDDLRVAQEIGDVGLLLLRIVELERAQRRVGENVDAEQLQVLARMIRQARDVVDGRRGGEDVGVVRHERIGRLVEAQAVADDLQVRLARDNVDRRAERLKRAVVDDLHREKHRHAKRDADDIERRQRRMPREVAQAVREKEAKHFGL